MKYKLNLKREQLEKIIGPIHFLRVLKGSSLTEEIMPPYLCVEIDSSQLVQLEEVCGHKEVQCLDCASVLSEGEIKWP